MMLDYQGGTCSLLLSSWCSTPVGCFHIVVQLAVAALALEIA